MKIIEVNKDIKSLVDENEGYCPCAVEKNKDTKCMCKEFRERVANNIPGECHCGLYRYEE